MSHDYITKEGMIRLEKRINYLLELRPEVVKQVVKAREMGDLSENAEYHAAKERQRHIDTEVDHLRRRMAKLKVVDTELLAKDCVRFGAYVEIQDMASSERFIYHLVGIDEVYERDDHIIQVSIASPLGKPMLSKKINEEFTVHAPIGDKLFKIISIK